MSCFGTRQGQRPSGKRVQSAIDRERALTAQSFPRFPGASTCPVWRAWFAHDVIGSVSGSGDRILMRKKHKTHTCSEIVLGIGKPKTLVEEFWGTARTPYNCNARR